MNLSVGTLLQNGKYRIVRFIAAGGFGCTYEGVHVMLGLRVAIKEFFPKTLCNRDETKCTISVGTLSQAPLVEKLKKKFIDEARSIHQLHHRGITNVHDIFEENNTAYYVMDYIDGRSLSDIIKEKGHLSEDETLHYLEQIADALAYVHSNNRLHLDIKPGNVMIDNENNAHIIDFGASKQYDEEKGENTSTLMGKTPGYAPLEQMGNDVVRFMPATDIYALGATLYKMLTGDTPVSATLLASGETLKPLPESVSKPMRDAVYAAMNANKNARPQTVKAFMDIVKGKAVVAPVQSSQGTENTILENHASESTILEPANHPNPSPAIPHIPQKPVAPAPVEAPEIEYEVDNSHRKRMIFMWIGIVIAIIGIGCSIYMFTHLKNNNATVATFADVESVTDTQDNDYSVIDDGIANKEEDEKKPDDYYETPMPPEQTAPQAPDEKAAVAEKKQEAPKTSTGVDDVSNTQVKEVVTVAEQPKPKEEKPKDDNFVYNIATVEQKPQFPGGEAALYKWLSEHIIYPESAAEKGIQGRVTVEFVVDKSGYISNAKVVRGKDPALDAEALRVVRSMPKWLPGRNNGQPVKVTYIIPITFKLQTN